MIDKKTDPVIVYLEDKFHNPKRDFLIQVFDQIPQSFPGQVALILGADVAEGDILLPLEKDYTLIAFDGQMIYYDLMIPNYEKYKNKINIIKKLNFETLPTLDLVMASFVLPFFPSEELKPMWSSLDEKIKPGGYFVGNFFDPRFEIFNGKDRKNMSFHTKDEVLDLFKNYEILKI